ncbi:hypothetical protein BDN67DRAFT_971834 [Paxillus ammoniavirescens]|nr:hypothetical protein BDN67DRAFT_971834 [Paxillus ammoniavirescens]
MEKDGALSRPRACSCDVDHGHHGDAGAVFCISVFDFPRQLPIRVIRARPIANPVSVFEARESFARRRAPYHLTSALFSIAHKLGLRELCPELLKDSRRLQLSVPLMGTTGDLTLRASPTDARVKHTVSLL